MSRTSYHRRRVATLTATFVSIVFVALFAGDNVFRAITGLDRASGPWLSGLSLGLLGAGLLFALSAGGRVTVGGSAASTAWSRSRFSIAVVAVVGANPLAMLAASEPIFHFVDNPFFQGQPPGDRRATSIALVMTLMHWGPLSVAAIVAWCIVLARPFSVNQRQTQDNNGGRAKHEEVPNPNGNSDTVSQGAASTDTTVATTVSALSDDAPTDLTPTTVSRNQDRPAAPNAARRWSLLCDALRVVAKRRPRTHRPRAARERHVGLWLGDKIAGLRAWPRHVPAVVVAACLAAAMVMLGEFLRMLAGFQDALGVVDATHSVYSEGASYLRLNRLTVLPALLVGASFVVLLLARPRIGFTILGLAATASLTGTMALLLLLPNHPPVTSALSALVSFETLRDVYRVIDLALAANIHPSVVDWQQSWSAHYARTLLVLAPVYAMCLVYLARGQSIRRLILTVLTAHVVVAGLWVFVVGAQSLAVVARDPGLVTRTMIDMSAAASAVVSSIQSDSGNERTLSLLVGVTAMINFLATCAVVCFAVLRFAASDGAWSWRHRVVCCAFVFVGTGFLATNTALAGRMATLMHGAAPAVIAALIAAALLQLFSVIRSGLRHNSDPYSGLGPAR